MHKPRRRGAPRRVLRSFCRRSSRRKSQISSSSASRHDRIALMQGDVTGYCVRRFGIHRRSTMTATRRDRCSRGCWAGRRQTTRALRYLPRRLTVHETGNQRSCKVRQRACAMNQLCPSSPGLVGPSSVGGRAVWRATIWRGGPSTLRGAGVGDGVLDWTAGNELVERHPRWQGPQDPTRG